MKTAKSNSKKSKKEKKSKDREKKSDRKERKAKRKEKKKQEKELKKQLIEEKKKKKLDKRDVVIPQAIVNPPIDATVNEDCGPPIGLMNRGNRPETKEEYDKRQSLIKRVHDPETGRIRLIKGDGEILEEMVSKDQHRRINREATDGDGRFFQNNTIGAGTFTDRY